MRILNICKLIILVSLTIFPSNAFSQSQAHRNRQMTEQEYLYLRDHEINVNSTRKFIHQHLHQTAGSMGHEVILNRLADIGGLSDAVFVIGGFTYIGVGFRFTILNTFDPGNPQLLGEYRFDDTVRDIFISGSLAFVATGSTGTYILDISDPLNIIEINHFETEGFSNEVIVEGRYAFIAETRDGLKIIDIANPYQPQQVGVVQSAAVRVCVIDNHAYISASDTLRVINVENPTMPEQLGTYFTGSASITALDVSGDFAYIGVKDTIKILNLSDLNNMSEAGFYHLEQGYPYDIEIVGTTAHYVNYQGFGILDISNPSNPTQIGYINLIEMTVKCYIKDNYAYIVGYENNLNIVNISNPQTLQRVGGWIGAVPTVEDMVVVGNNVFIAGGLAGLRIVNVQIPEQPVLLGNFNYSGMSAYSVDVVGNYAYVGDGEILRVLDVSDLTNPSEVANINVALNYISAIVVRDNYAFLTCTHLGFVVIDIANPMQPQIKANINTPGTANNLVIKGGYAYIADGFSGMRIIDISTPTNPTEVSSNADYSPVIDVAINANYLFVAERYSSSIKIFDVSNAGLPTFAGSCQTQVVDPFSLFARGNLFYVAGGYGIQVIDISDPVTPVIVSDYYTSTGFISDIIATDHYAFSGDYTVGLCVYGIEEKISATIVSVTTTEDSGPGSLREAIAQANTNTGPDSIIFQISTSDPHYNPETGVWTITPLTALPVISDSFTVIDGLSQKEFTGDTNPFGLEIELDGSEAEGFPAHGLFILSPKNLVQGLVINRFQHSGILLTSPSAVENKIVNNIIGASARIDAILPNGQYGVYIAEGARNQIGSLDGIILNKSNEKNRKSICEIGKHNSKQNDLLGQNIIACNLDGGIYISGEVANDNQIINNQIIFNGSHGILLSDWVKRTLIFWNAIAFNEGAGVVVRGWNADQNTITTNLITENGSLGILLDGGNQMIPAPIIETVTDISIAGSAPPNAVIELFGDMNDEGEQFLGATTSDATGSFEWSGFVTGSKVTATATDAVGNTSQFSDPVGYLGLLFVTTTADEGVGSLRQAFIDADEQPGRNTILFQIPIDDINYNPDIGVWTIQPKSYLPRIIDDDLFIHGDSQAEFIGADTNPEGPEIEIDGSEAGSDVYGINSDGSSNLSIYGLVINRFDYAGIGLFKVNGGHIAGCYIGTDAKGQQPLGNNEGILLYETDNVLVGALDSTAAGNIVSGNRGVGIALHNSSKHNFIVGNFIGPDLQGSMLSESNTMGVFITTLSDSNYVACNRIGSNRTYGIYVSDNSKYNTIEANEIGTDIIWQMDIGNQSAGIVISQSRKNQIVRNVVGYSGSDGIVIYGAGAVENLITQNGISKNTRKGIVNDNGGNVALPAPSIQSISSTHVQGNTGPIQTIEFFTDESDEGQIYLGNSTSDASGNFSFQLPDISLLAYITATAIDSVGNTSEFCTAVPTDVKTKPSLAVPSNYQLYQNYPNPFNPITTLSYALPRPSHVTLTIFNLSGQEIETIVKKTHVAGVYKIQWNSKNLPSGVYLCRFEAGTFLQMRKLVLIK